MKTLIRIVLIGVAMLVGSVQAADPLVITSGTDRATPIAVVPFGWQGGTVLPTDISEVVGNDLRNSGYFEPIPRQNMISLPTQASEVIYRDWKALGAQYVLVGSVVPAGGRLQVQFALFGGVEVSGASLLRFYVLHVLGFPFIIVIFMAVHFWRVRKDGGISGPL